MKALQLLALGTLAGWTGLAFSQTLPPTVPSIKLQHYANLHAGGPARVFQLGEKRYRSRLDQPQLLAGPDWKPSRPLPLSVASAERIARAELRKLTPGDAGWEATGIRLKRMPGSNQPKWYYVVTLAPTPKNPERPSNSFFVLINLAGQPGSVEL